jgi:hypothetical protein
MSKRSVIIQSLFCATMGAALLVLPVAAQDPPAANSLVNSSADSQLGSLRICLRLNDQTPFLGAATVRVLPETGFELLGARDAETGETDFFAVAPGKYTVYVTAPAYLDIHLRTEMEKGGPVKTLYVLMKRPSDVRDGKDVKDPQDPPKPSEAPDIFASPEPVELRTEASIPLPNEIPIAPFTPAKAESFAEPPPEQNKEEWKPVDWKDDGVVVDHSIACPSQQLLHIAGDRVKEFANSLEKFTAMENVEHFSVDKAGDRHGRETRKFSYVVTVTKNRYGTLMFDEYRNGGMDPTLFPANIATLGLPALVLVFHPNYSPDFNFNCDGMVSAAGHDYWQVSFAQRVDRPVKIQTYVVNGFSFPIYLQGRAWIDPGRGEVVRLESQLEKPIPQIELWQQHQVIDYIGVKFASTGQTVWLPQAAEVYVERHGKRYYRRHYFEDYRLFNVDTAQNQKAPKGSYSFTNLTDADMIGELTVNPIDGVKGGPVVLRFEVPARRTIVKMVGPGKDVNLTPADVASARFVHTGDSDAVKVDVDLVKETTLDVIPRSALANP